MTSKIIVKTSNRNTKHIKELFENYTKSPSIMEIKIACLKDGWSEKIVKKMKKPTLPKIEWNGKSRVWVKVEPQEPDEPDAPEEVPHAIDDFALEEVPHATDDPDATEEDADEPDEGFDIDEFRDEPEEEEDATEEEEPDTSH